MPARLSSHDLEAGLKELPGWGVSADGKSINRLYELKDFSEAFGFMTQVAFAAEKLDHHPDWSNSWNKVDLSLSTHSANGLTTLDLQLARQIDAIFARTEPPQV